MALPKISNPLFVTKLPSDGTEVTFRPFLVKEEKALLVAGEAKDSDSTIRATCQVLQNCIVSPELDVSKLPTFDIEYLFMKLRSKSVGEVATLRYKHSDGVNRSGVKCDGVSEISVDLDKVECQKTEGHTRDIKISDKYTVRMRYPTIDNVKKIVSMDAGGVSSMMDMMADCLECVYDSENSFEPDSKRESIEFIDSLSQEQMRRIVEFFSTMPRLNHTAKYSCPSCGQEDTVTLRGLNDFF